MADDDGMLVYVLDAIDNVTPVTDKVSAGQDQVASAARSAQDAIDSESIAFVKQLSQVSALRHGMVSLTNGAETLGLVSDSTAKKLDMVNASAGMLVGTFQLFKAVQPILNGIKITELEIAAIETFRSVLHNPLAMAAVGVAAGAAMGVGGMMAFSNNSSNSTNVNQTIVFGSGSSSDQRSTARASFEAMGGF
jgi:hypothetical protein